MPAARTVEPLLARAKVIDRLPPQARGLASTVGPALGVLVVQLLFFPVPPGVFLRGIIVGLLGALAPDLDDDE